jgi:pimeloyl-ACP methyl ester carboxylesterase
MKRVLIGILVLIVLGVGVGPFLVPVPPLTDTVPATQLADADSRFIAVDGVQLHYKVDGAAGDAPAFLLLHGFGASTFSWRSVRADFGTDALTISYDRPAFGLSERPLEPEDGWGEANPYGTHANVRQALGLLDALQVRRAVLVGNSAGGRTAVDIALAHPERVAALVLVSPAVGMGGGPPGWIAPLLRTPQLDHLGPLLVRRISGSGGSQLLNAAWHDPSKITPEVLAGYRTPLRANDWDRALWSFTQAPRTDDPLPRLGELARIPTLVISGDDDRVVPVDTSRAVAAALPGSELVLLPACGHVPQEECPQAFMAAVRVFLAKHAAP